MENNIEINVHRTNRLKTVSIQVLRGEVKISVPKNLEQIKIDKILKSKSKWIKKKLFLQSKIVPFSNKEYVSGESFLYLGRLYRLKIIIGKKYNTEFYKLIKKFKQLTKCPLLINTSFNVRGEPIVCSPKDAIECFMSTNLDALVIENYFILKQEQDKKLKSIYVREFELD